METVIGNLIDICAVSMLLASILSMTAVRMKPLIRLFSIQSLFLGAMAAIIAYSSGNSHIYIMCGLTVVIKGFLIPKIFLKALIKDQMFVSSFNIGVSAFVSVPLCLIIPTIVLWIFAGFYWALGYFVAFPLMFILAWNYMRMWQKFKGSCNFVKPGNRQKINELRTLRKSIYDRLDAIIAKLS